ncbi:MAG: DinB family protein [Bacteroidales bacterium]|nr:DinB family protein [Bacteroidales bacterium]MBN2817693.1 DinB family protein [Bacteroidales bacterium]
MIFIEITQGIQQGLDAWENKLKELPLETITQKRNSQNRTIKQILGHMVDSASNNTHRIVHLQYQKCPFNFPNYATNGNNDRWIAIQNYQDENWENLVQLWKYSHIHYMHVVNHVNENKLANEWVSGSEYGNVSLKEMIVDFLRHFNLHLSEIQCIIDS